MSLNMDAEESFLIQNQDPIDKIQAQLLCYARDINRLVAERSALIEKHAKLLEQAHHDPLTGLPNRRLLSDRIEQAIAQAWRNIGGFAVLYVDLDRLKPINDTHGHSFGDAALKIQSDRMVNSLRKIDTVARVGGDEFIILAHGLTLKSEICKLAEKLLAALSEPIYWDGVELTMGASIGIVRFPEDATDKDSLYCLADHVMYDVKRAGGGCYRLYHPTEAA